MEQNAKASTPGWQADLIAAVQDADLVACVLSDGTVTQHIIEQILPHLKPGTVIAQHATIGPDETQALAAMAHQADMRYLDMPFTGSQPAAVARQTVFFVGDDADVFSEVESCYQSLSSHRFACGNIGQAAAIKAMNLIIAGTYQAMAEGLSLARSAGLSDELFFTVFDKNISWPDWQILKARKRQADWAPQFSIKHLHKDLHLALRLGQQQGYLPPGCERIAQLYSQALADGNGDKDFAAIMETN